MNIAKRFTFDAAHQLLTLPPSHKCHHLHGHTYEVEIIVYGCDTDLDEHGMLADYQKIADAWAEIHHLLDHKYLNDIPGLGKPTTENLAIWIINGLLDTSPWLREFVQTETGNVRNRVRLSAVRVYESTTTYCEVFVSELPSRPAP